MSTPMAHSRDVRGTKERDLEVAGYLPSSDALRASLGRTAHAWIERSDEAGAWPASRRQVAALVDGRGVFEVARYEGWAASELTPHGWVYRGDIGQQPSVLALTLKLRRLSPRCMVCLSAVGAREHPTWLMREGSE